MPDKPLNPTALSQASDKSAALKALRSHKWTGLQRGGNPADAGSYEWVRYCEVCGIEDTCEDPLPICGDTPKSEAPTGLPEVAR